MPRAAGEKRPRQLSPLRLREEAEKLRGRLAQIEAQERSHDAQRHTLIGQAVLLHALSNSAFKAELDRILDATIADKGQRRILGLTPRRGGRRATGAALPTTAGTGTRSE